MDKLIDLNQVRDLTTAANKPFQPDDGDLLLIPKDYILKDLADYRNNPARIDELLTFREVESYCDYISRFNNDSAVIFNSDIDCKMKCVIDYHKASEPSWCSHRAAFCPKHSPEWMTWAASNKNKYRQTEFAEFIDQNIADIIGPGKEGIPKTAPTGSQMLGVATSLQATRNVEFKSDMRLDNGQTQMAYEETIRGSAQAGKIDIPESFFLAISVFQHGPKYVLEAKLRYRLDDTKLVFFYDLVRRDKVKDHAYQELKKAISDELVKIPMYEGTV